MCVCVCLCVRACVCACVRACVLVCMCKCVGNGVRVWVCDYLCVCACTRVCFCVSSVREFFFFKRNFFVTRSVIVGKCVGRAGVLRVLEDVLMCDGVCN